MKTYQFKIVARNDESEATCDVVINVTDKPASYLGDGPVTITWPAGEPFVPEDFSGRFDGTNLTFSAVDIPEGLILTEAGMLQGA